MVYPDTNTATPLSILSIEDHLEIQAIIEMALQFDKSISVVSVATRTEALTVLENGVFSPDCIVLSMTLRERDSMALLKQIRDIEAYRSTPVALLSTLEMPIIGVPGCEYCDLILKPFDPLALARQLRAFVQRPAP